MKTDGSMKLTKSLSDMVVRSWVVGEKGCVRPDEAVTFLFGAEFTTMACWTDELEDCL